MADPLTALFHICTPLQQGPVLIGTHLAAMAALGLAGSLVHCGPMCGPLVLGQAAGRMSCLTCENMTESKRLRAGLVPRYHAGRIMTYAIMGAAAGAAGLGATAALRPLRGLALFAAALILLVIAWRRYRAGPTAAAALDFQRPLLRVLRPGSLVFGMVLGLLPCGLVYTALLAATATASPIWGALGMAAFGAGTVPMLASIGVAGNLKLARPWLLRAAPAMFAVNAAILLAASVQASFAGLF